MSGTHDAEAGAEAGGDRWGRGVDDLPIVLTGGPADGQWYGRDDFTQRQTAARRMAAIHHRTPLAPASWPLLYKPTTTISTHHRDPGKQAVQWRWTGPAGVRNLPDLQQLSDTTTQEGEGGAGYGA
jgi:hypothetical protein